MKHLSKLIFTFVAIIMFVGTANASPLMSGPFGLFKRATIQQTQTKPKRYRYAYKSQSHKNIPTGRHNVGARPARWCGWWMRTQKGGGPEFNLAANWKYYGRPSGPQVGAVVVWAHHVGMITGKTAQGWIVKSGNDGGRARERVRSVKGAVFRI